MSKETTKQIASLSELLDIKTKDHISIITDIDCGGKTVPFIAELFRGSIEGNNHTISNIVLGVDVWGDEQSIALFHYLSRATILNLHFKNVHFEIDKNGYTPRIAGFCYECGASTIDNVSLDLTTSFGEDIPFIFEENSCNISNVTLTCNGNPVEVETI